MEEKKIVNEWVELVGRPDTELLKRMVDSELIELLEAKIAKDRVEMFDAVIDSLFLIYQFSDEDLGLWVSNEVIITHILRISNEGWLQYRAPIQQGLRAVLKSNLTKFCKTYEEAEESIKAYGKEGLKFTIDKIKEFYVIKDETGKIRKPLGFKAPTEDLIEILKNHELWLLNP